MLPTEVTTHTTKCVVSIPSFSNLTKCAVSNLLSDDLMFRTLFIDHLLFLGCRVINFIEKAF